MIGASLSTQVGTVTLGHTCEDQVSNFGLGCLQVPGAVLRDHDAARESGRPGAGFSWSLSLRAIDRDHDSDCSEVLLLLVGLQVSGL